MGERHTADTSWYQGYKYCNVVLAHSHLLLYDLALIIHRLIPRATQLVSWPNMLVLLTVCHYPNLTTLTLNPYAHPFEAIGLISLLSHTWQCVFDPRSFLVPQYGPSVTILSFSSPLRVCLAGLPEPDRHDIGQSSPLRDTPVLRLGRVCYRCASRASTTIHRIPRRR